MGHRLLHHPAPEYLSELYLSLALLGLAGLACLFFLPLAPILCLPALFLSNECLSAAHSRWERVAADVCLLTAFVVGLVTAVLAATLILQGIDAFHDAMFFPGSEVRGQ